MAATKKSTQRRAPSRGPAKRPPRTPVREHLEPWKRDAWGIGLVVGALLFALGLWFQTGGWGFVTLVMAPGGRVLG